MKNVKQCRLIKNVLRKNKNICLRYIMPTHRTRDDRRRQLNRSRGMIRERYEPGSVGERAAKERSALRTDGFSSLITRANDVVQPGSEGAQQRRIQKKLRELGEHASLQDYLEMLEAEEAFMEASREKSATIKLGAIILSSILLILMITYVPGAAASAAAKKASWFGWLTGSSSLTTLEQLSMEFPQGLTIVLGKIREINPDFFNALQNAGIGVAGALQKANFNTVVLAILKKFGNLFIYNTIYQKVLGKSKEEAESEPEKEELINEVDRKTISYLQEDLDRLSRVEGDDAVAAYQGLGRGYGGGIRTKHKKTKKKRRTKRGATKKRRVTIKSSKKRQRKSRRRRK